MPWAEHLAGCTLTELRAHKPGDESDADQFAAARSAAAELIGVVGDKKGQRFNVGLTGHANPDHEQQDGVPADWVTVSVSQAEASG